MSLRWSRPAQRDVAAIVEYIAEHNPDAAAEMRNRIVEAVLLLRDAPRLGVRDQRLNARVLTVARTSYRVVYQVHDAEVAVLRVVHAARQSPPSLS